MKGTQRIVREDMSSEVRVSQERQPVPVEVTLATGQQEQQMKTIRAIIVQKAVPSD